MKPYAMKAVTVGITAMKQHKPFAILDTETTGLDPTKHEIIEIAVKSPLGTFHSLVKPQRLDLAEPKALELNGYAANPDR